MLLAALTSAKNDFAGKVAATAEGGPASTAAKNESRAVLIDLLYQEAQYVQLTANNDLAVLLSSGFLAMNTNRASTPLEKPATIGVRNGSSGELVAKIPPVKNTSLYEIRAMPDGGDWLPSMYSGDSRNISITGLTPGTKYTIQVRALGGSTGQGDWSDPVQHISL